MVNLPFADGTAALRVVGTETHNSGWIDRIVIADGAFPLETNGNTTRGNVLAAPVAADYKRYNDAELSGIRASLLWRPTDRLSMTASGFRQTITQGGLNEIEVPPGGNAFYQPFDVPQTFDDRFTLGSFTLQYRFDAFDLTSATSRWTRREDIHFDASEPFQWAFSTPTKLFPFNSSQGGLGPNSPSSLEEDRTTQTSEEVRLASNTESKFKWLVGYFYQDFTSETDLPILFPGAVSLFGTGNMITQIQPAKITQNAFFGEASYQLTPSLKATVGLRRYSFDSSLETTVSGAISSTGSDVTATSSNSQSASGVNPKFNLSYQVNEELLLYTTIAEGFRPGGANQPIPTTGAVGSACEAALQANHGTTAFVASPLAFAPDTVWNYEIGEKFRTAGGRLTVNSAVYYENWQKVQQEIALGCGFPYTDNAGEVHVYGSEVEINALLIPGLVLSANAGYTHANFAIGSLETGVTPGTPVQGIPLWTSSQSLEYHHRISDQLSLIGRIENNYIDGRTAVAFKVIELPPYDLTNVRIGIEGDRWSATLFAKNALNKQVLLSPSIAISNYTTTFTPYTVNQPLTFGIDLNYHFGR
jgi:outer membrane receptor protein involved in Fe transport